MATSKDFVVRNGLQVGETITVGDTTISSNGISISNTEVVSANGTISYSSISNLPTLYTTADANTDIDARVTQAFVNALNVTAAGVQADSVALGTDTTGNYVTSVSGGTGVTITGGTGEGATPSIAIGQDVSTSANVTFQDMNLTGDLQIDGDFTVSGNVVSVNVQELSVEDNLIYLNANAATANPDLGWAGGYNDGTYAHAGMFRDATDGIFKAFTGYTPEPDASAYIDTTHASFALADLQANTFIGNISATGGSIDGTVIGGTTPAAISGTTGQFNTSLNVDGAVTADGLTVDGIAEISNFAAIGDGFISGGTASTLTYQAEDHNFKNAANNKSFLAIDGSTGDISFYEDTGTTPKFFWDASAEALGIGTSSPAVPLHISNSNPTIRYQDSDGTNQYGEVQMAGGNFIIQSRNDTADGGILFRGVGGGTATEHMRITSTGSVGIGTTSPSATLGIVGTSGSPQFGAGTAGNGLFINAFDSNPIYMTASVTNSTAFGFGAASNIPLFFMTNNTERMRIDSSGNVLVGKTSIGLSTTGIDLRSTGLLQAIRDGGTVVELNRQTSDGTIIDFRKDNTTVGSIGVISTSNFFTGSGASGITFRSAVPDIVPSENGFNRDGTTNLGNSLARFKDLYLSGGLRADTLTFSTLAGTERMRIDSSGNVGIGTTSPTDLLHIRREITDNGIVYPLYIEAKDDGNNIDQLAGDGVGIFMRFAGNSSGTPGNSIGGARISTSRTNASDAVANSRLQFDTHNGTEYSTALTIDDSGNVGIGTTNPSTALDVNGTVTATAFSGNGSALTNLPSPTGVMSSTNPVVTSGTIQEAVQVTNITNHAIDPTQGAIQHLTFVVTSSVTLSFSGNFDNGHVVLLSFVRSTGGDTVTWPFMRWVGSSDVAPTAISNSVSNPTIVLIWKIDNEYYGSIINEGSI